MAVRRDLRFDEDEDLELARVRELSLDLVCDLGILRITMPLQEQ